MTENANEHANLLQSRQSNYSSKLESSYIGKPPVYKNKKYLAIGGAVLLVIVVTIILACTLSGGSDDSSSGGGGGSDPSRYKDSVFTVKMDLSVEDTQIFDQTTPEDLNCDQFKAKISEQVGSTNWQILDLFNGEMDSESMNAMLYCFANAPEISTSGLTWLSLNGWLDLGATLDEDVLDMFASKADGSQGDMTYHLYNMSPLPDDQKDQLINFSLKILDGSYYHIEELDFYNNNFSASQSQTLVEGIQNSNSLSNIWIQLRLDGVDFSNDDTAVALANILDGAQFSTLDIRQQVGDHYIHVDYEPKNAYF